MVSCHDCIVTSGGCCNTAFTDRWKIILLPNEVKRISKLTGKDPSEFVDTSPLAPSQLRWYVCQYAVEDPLWVQLVSLWGHPVGLKNSCPFLTCEGCSLPYQDKPFLCQVYPLDFNITRGDIFLPKDTSCPVGQSASAEEKVPAYFGDDWEGLQRRFRLFRTHLLLLLGTVLGIQHSRRQSPSSLGRTPIFSGW
jgi:Fe-S-cluster containining protein